MEVVFFFFIMLVAIICIVSIGFSIITIIGQWKVFEKANKPGWAALIPFYNMWVLYEISGVNPLFIFFLLGAQFFNMVGSVFNIFAGAGNDFDVFFALLSIGSNFISFGLSITSLVFTIKAALNLAKYFNKSAGYGLGLAFLGFIFYPMLGLDKDATYNKID